MQSLTGDGMLLGDSYVCVFLISCSVLMVIIVAHFQLIFNDKVGDEKRKHS